MKDKFYLLVISLSMLHHEVITQKANFCNITETYFVEVTKTETILGFKKPTGFSLMGLITGSNKYENITKTVQGVEKRERVVEDCCKDYKRIGDECVPIHEEKSTTKSTAVSSIATESSTSQSPSPSSSETPPAPIATSPKTIEPSTTESPQAPEPSPETSSVEIIRSETTPSPRLEPSPPESHSITTPETPTPGPEPSTESSNIEIKPSETPAVTTEIKSPELSSTEAPQISSTSPAPESKPELPTEPPAPVTESKSPELPSTTQPSFPVTESKPVSATEPSPPQIDTTPATLQTIIIPSLTSTSSELSPTPLIVQPTQPTNEKLVERVTDPVAVDPDLTTVIRRKRRIEVSSISVDFDKVTETYDHPSIDINESYPTADYQDGIVISDLDSNDQNTTWVEVLELISIGAIIFLLVITVQASYDSAPLSSLWAGNKKNHEIDSYGEYWIYDSTVSLEEV